MLSLFFLIILNTRHSLRSLLVKEILATNRNQPASIFFDKGNTISFNRRLRLPVHQRWQRDRPTFELSISLWDVYLVDSTPKRFLPWLLQSNFSSLGSTTIFPTYPYKLPPLSFILQPCITNRSRSNIIVQNIYASFSFVAET